MCLGFTPNGEHAITYDVINVFGHPDWVFGEKSVAIAIGSGSSKHKKFDTSERFTKNIPGERRHMMPLLYLEFFTKQKDQ
jgi:hypothetical protein